MRSHPSTRGAGRAALGALTILPLSWSVVAAAPPGPALPESLAIASSSTPTRGPTVLFHGEDEPLAHTYFANSPESRDVLLVRFVGSEVFHVLPPGEFAIVHDTGVVEGSVPLDSFEALLAGSQTGVAYKVTAAQNMERSTDPNGPWTAIAVNDVLTSCMWYQRATQNTSSMTVTDVATGAKLSMPQRGDIFIIVPHHVPWDPQFRNINHYDDFADFNYADVDITDDVAQVTDTSEYKPEGAQIGLRGSFGEAVAPQRIGGGPTCQDVKKLTAKCKRDGTITGKVVMRDESFDGWTVTVMIDGHASVTATINGRRAKYGDCCYTGGHTVELVDPPNCHLTKNVTCG